MSNNYTLMPTNMKAPSPPEQPTPQRVSLYGGFSFTKGCALTMKIDARGPAWGGAVHDGHMLYDLATDPEQTQPINDPAIEQTMIDHLARLMGEVDAPAEQYKRLGLAAGATPAGALTQ